MADAVELTIFEIPLGKARLSAPANALAVKRAERIAEDLARTVGMAFKGGVKFEVARTNDVVRVFTTDERFIYIDQGTRPHVIRARNGGALVFRVGGQARTKPNTFAVAQGREGNRVVVVKQVNHPGTAARNWSKMAAEQAVEPLALEILSQVTSALARRLEKWL